MLIKRGCTNYERKCGPSDHYTFEPKLEEIETALLSQFVKPAAPEQRLDRKRQDAIRFINLMQIAYRIGDDSYKEFNGGRSLYRPTITYSPDP